jgi:glycosyltransferase involved in cell wall biosynthesis
MTAPQKIVHLIGSLGQFGVSCTLRELAASQAAAGADVTVTVIAFAANPQAQQDLQVQGVTTEVIRKRWDYDPFAARQLLQSLRELQPHVVHLWGKRATNVVLTVRRALPEAALLATLNDLPQLANPWWPNKSLVALDAIAVERQATCEEFIDAGQGEQKVHVIPPGVGPIAADTATKRELFLHLGLPSESRLITIAGPLERWQLVDEAIWCFELIRILHEHFCLVIVGDGAERSRLERFTRQVTDPHVVRFVTKPELLPTVLTHSEIYWQPGTSRAIPAALLQALARGLPIVASDTPAHRAVIQSDKNGFLVPPAKRAVWARQTDQLIRNVDLRIKFARAACQTAVEKFPLSATIDGYTKLYDELAAARYHLCSAPS